ncbi:MAG: hypothetical protein KVP17_000013 [Porospora cf. gigantea B]|uniref:uncharacterized protein n=1 Tax=Porospora cf. gigantea B TaxID=2853592 RepID=UPI003571CD82|nr:MAG: hypothetical protein KVP17_000013 [Porospora cf. gigantea B]
MSDIRRCNSLRPSICKRVPDFFAFCAYVQQYRRWMKSLKAPSATQVKVVKLLNRMRFMWEECEDDESLVWLVGKHCKSQAFRLSHAR